MAVGIVKAPLNALVQLLLSPLKRKPLTLTFIVVSQIAVVLLSLLMMILLALRCYSIVISILIGVMLFNHLHLFLVKLGR